jgi:hypothetical protein
MAHKKRSKRPIARKFCGNQQTGGSVTQSLVFDKAVHAPGKPAWTPRTTTAWARAHGYRVGKVHETPPTERYPEGTIRLRQFDPAACQYRPVPFGRSGISGVVELAKRAPAHVLRAVAAEEASRGRKRR